MPYIALNEFDDEVTAFQCRDEYVRSGVEYRNFRCAFCEVRYFSKSIYHSDPYRGTAPHFSLYKGEAHIPPCDGTPLVIEVAPDPKGRAREVLGASYEIPEKLVSKPVPRRVLNIKDLRDRDRPTSQEIRRRRKAAGDFYRNAKYTSSLLLTFVQARDFLTKEARKLIRAKKHEVKDDFSFIKSVWDEFPLDLFGVRLTYKTAFWNANHSRESNHPRIFYSNRGVVSNTLAGFEIVAELGKESSGDVTTKILINTADIVGLPTRHQKLVDKLIDLVRSGSSVKWHAYGRMEKTAEESVRQIVLENLDYLVLGDI